MDAELIIIDYTYCAICCHGNNCGIQAVITAISVIIIIILTAITESIIFLLLSSISII